MTLLEEGHKRAEAEELVPQRVRAATGGEEIALDAVPMSGDIGRLGVANGQAVPQSIPMVEERVDRRDRRGAPEAHGMGRDEAGVAVGIDAEALIGETLDP